MVLASTRNLLNQWFPPKPIFTEKDIPSQQGKVFIITGGNGAVGSALTKMLYNAGGTVYMACRSRVISLPFLSNSKHNLTHLSPRRKPKRQSVL